MAPEQDDIHTEASDTNASLGMECVLAAQHVLVLFSGIILIPVMLVKLYDFTNNDAHYFISLTALCAAASTLLQLIRKGKFGLGSPMFMGTSGAFLACAHGAIELGGTALLAGMVLVSAPFQALFAYLIRFMRHILTPTVGGVIIMLAVVGLLKDSVLTWTHSSHTTGIEAYQDIITGGITIGVMLAVEWFGGKRMRPWALPLGIAVGSMFAIGTGIPPVVGLGTASWIGLPQGEWPGIAFSVGDTKHWILTLTFVMAVLATSIKYTGDAMILQKVADPTQRKIDYDALQGGLYANSFGMLLAGSAGGMPSSSHSANIPLMEMTGVATRRIAIIASLFLAAVALSPKMLLILLNIPQPVIGGVGVVLVAHLFSSGMQLIAADLNHRNGIIVGLSLCAGLIAADGTFFPDAFPDSFDPLLHNGVALGGVVAVILTLITQLGTHRAVVIKILPTIEHLVTLKAQLHRISGEKLGLDPTQAGHLEIACEEVFLYMREAFTDSNFNGPIRFSFRQKESTIEVEVSGGTKLDSEADAIAATASTNAETLAEAELNTLGLFLLGRFASNVTHVNIANYTYISFSIPSE